MRRAWRLALLLTQAALATRAPAVRAQGSELSPRDFTLRLQRNQDGKWLDLHAEEQDGFFNRARCECRTPLRMVAQATDAGRAKIQSGGGGPGSVSLAFGQNCRRPNDPAAGAV